MPSGADDGEDEFVPFLPSLLARRATANSAPVEASDAPESEQLAAVGVPMEIASDPEPVAYTAADAKRREANRKKRERQKAKRAAATADAAPTDVDAASAARPAEPTAQPDGGGIVTSLMELSVSEGGVPTPSPTEDGEDGVWNGRLVPFGLRVHRDGASGRSLACSRAFSRGDDVLREAPIASVRFDEPWSALEAALAQRFNLSKIAPPYRLLARILTTSAHLLDPTRSPVPTLAAEMALVESKWPLAFCTFLAEHASGERMPLGAVMRMFAILKTNAHGIYRVGADGAMANVGLGLYPLVSLTNHDCDPSAVWSFEGEEMVLRALRPLAAGGAFSISYVLPREPPNARRHKLRESYRFECVCARCAREAPRADEFAGLAAEYRQVCTALDAVGAPAALESDVGAACQLAEDTAATAAGGGAEQMTEGAGEQLAALLTRCAELLERLTTRDCCHPETAHRRARLGQLWWLLAERRAAAPTPRGRKAAPAKRREGARHGALVGSHFERATQELRRAREMLAISLGPRHALLAAVDAALAKVAARSEASREGSGAGAQQCISSVQVHR